MNDATSFSLCSWCAPCKQLAPLLEAAVRNSGGRLALAKLNVDNNPTLSRQVGLPSHPLSLLCIF
jgi:putative thioredoxin